ncbi:hypothetical protein [Micromonospora sp. C95]|uniref:hypothetical protein n=1 Tax=Micromonospora sp. C95 TaxID=2824882 RepID=UPI001B395E63|nr:hypothetical protein [Micromonospora sp. C95]MBQ1026169.1 hypothetical protein [Micromonospora sp. C95]
MARRSSIRRLVRSAWVRLAHGVRTRTLPVLLVFAGLSGIMLLLARGAAEYGRTLAMELGAEFLGALVVIFALTPIVRRSQQGRVREHRHLDFSWYTDRVMTATASVRILHTFSRLFSPPYSQRFFSAAAGLIRRGGRVEVLLMHPDSVAAVLRTTELAGRRDVSQESRRNLQTLEAFRQSLDENFRARFEIRLYTASASVQMYQWDDRLLASFLPLGKLSGDHSQLEVSTVSPLGSFVTERADELWDGGMALTEYWLTSVTLTDDEGRRQYACRFLDIGDRHYLADARVIAQLARAQNGSVRVEFRQCPGTVHGVDVITEGDPDLASVRQRFLEKYGQSETVFIRLNPFPPA